MTRKLCKKLYVILSKAYYHTTKLLTVKFRQGTHIKFTSISGRSSCTPLLIKDKRSSYKMQISQKLLQNSTHVIATLKTQSKYELLYNLAHSGAPNKLSSDRSSYKTQFTQKLLYETQLKDMSCYTVYNPVLLGVLKVQLMLKLLLNIAQWSYYKTHLRQELL